ncbi:hypothetical protein DBW_0748 [Desulfuromonas sp. DDH964]|nr:hypothetical protein DBW_0748 [Desulfuromonas sp. DDH964]
MNFPPIRIEEAILPADKKGAPFDLPKVDILNG